METRIKSAIITGGGQRIGAEIAKARGKQGWFVYLHCHSSITAAKVILAEIENQGGKGKLICADLSSPSCGENIINQIDVEAPPVKLLINNP